MGLLCVCVCVCVYVCVFQLFFFLYFFVVVVGGLKSDEKMIVCDQTDFHCFFVVGCLLGFNVSCTVL